MTRICFVCHGNICRSPMAEAVFREMISKRHLESLFQTDSAAVSAEELGNGIYPPAQAELRRHGLPRSDHRAWQLHAEDYDRFDLFLGMDQSNVLRMRRIFGGDPQDKVRLLLDYTDDPREVEDPWYTGRFERVFDDVTKGCEGLLDSLMDEGGKEG